MRQEGAFSKNLGKINAIFCFSLPYLHPEDHPLLPPLPLQTSLEDFPSPPLPHLLLLPLPPPGQLPHSQQWSQPCKQYLQCLANLCRGVSPLPVYLTSCLCQPCHLLFWRISSAYSPQLTSSVNQSVCLC